jgi:hypothetical protein
MNMMKNRLLLGTVAASMIAFAACGGEREDTTIIEQPVVTEQPTTTTPTMEPAPAPMTTDTMMMPGDTMMMPLDTMPRP